MESSDNRETAEMLLSFSIRVNNWLRQQFRGHMEKTGYNLTPSQFKTLIMIRRLKLCKMSDLSEHSYVSTSSLTVMLNKLVDEGFVERVNDPADRRVVMVRLTAKGRELLSYVENRNLDALAEKLTVLPAETQERMHCFLQDVWGIIATLQNAPEREPTAPGAGK